MDIDVSTDVCVAAVVIVIDIRISLGVSVDGGLVVGMCVDGHIDVGLGDEVEVEIELKIGPAATIFRGNGWQDKPWSSCTASRSSLASLRARPCATNRTHQRFTSDLETAHHAPRRATAWRACVPGPAPPTAHTSASPQIWRRCIMPRVAQQLGELACQALRHQPLAPALHLGFGDVASCRT